MKYSVAIGGRSIEVEVEGDRVTVGGRRVSAHLVSVEGTPLKRLVIDGDSQVYMMERGADGWLVTSRGESVVAEVVDERTSQIRRVTGRRSERLVGGAVRAPMPGLVLRIEVAVGDTIVRGRGLVVLEAMKMENEIAAPASGIVRAVLVTPGQVVEKGTPLLELVTQSQPPQA